ncbi:MAG: hypothetical protein ACLFN1_06515 [Bacteroidales bacterium]
MNIKYLTATALLLFVITGTIISQHEPVDLNMVYKIKQEGFKNSDIEDLSFWMTDFTGPRLTASKGKKRADEWADSRMKEYGLENVRIETARPFDRGGWDNQKTYVAMTAPYYTNFAANPKAWTGSTRGAVKGSPVLLDINNEDDFEKYKGQLKERSLLCLQTALPK